MANGSSTVSSAKDMAEAAKVWLGRLGEEQRAKATFPFETAERLNWNFIPMTRQGLSRGEMDGAALEAADALMSTGLSTNAYERARQIIDHELILGEIEARSGGSGFHRRPELYFHTVFGEPGEGPWGWRVDGHHLSLNFTIVDGEVAGSTPCFLGANPAEVFHGPHKGLRIMRQEEDLARELFVSLDSDLRSIATIYPVAPSEIIMRASDRVTIGSPAGVAAGALPADSRDRLMALVKLYVDRHEGGLSASSMREIEAAGVGTSTLDGQAATGVASRITIVFTGRASSWSTTTRRTTRTTCTQCGGTSTATSGTTRWERTTRPRTRANQGRR